MSVCPQFICRVTKSCNFESLCFYDLPLAPVLQIPVRFEKMNQIVICSYTKMLLPKSIMMQVIEKGTFIVH